MTEPIAFPSTTGVPLFPAWLAKAATVVVLIAGALQQVDLFPGSTVDERILAGIIAVGTAFGISSQGWRKT